jgi:carbon-monoxide dehydrogenase medium subunit
VRNVATIGGAVAYGEPQTDTPVALTAMGATVNASGPTGKREIPIAEFYRAAYETTLEDGEIVTGIDVPRPAEGSVGCHMKFTIGSPENKPVANVSSLLTVDASGKCTAATVVIGAVGPTPLVAAAASGLIGELPTEARIREVAAAAAEETSPIDDVRGPAWYKRRIARVLVERSIACALQKHR